jgi:hypothetical protein
LLAQFGKLPSRHQRRLHVIGEQGAGLRRD